jgi:hypothetical protein
VRDVPLLRLLALALALLSSSGCAYSLIHRGQLRQAEFDDVLMRTMAARQLFVEVPVRVVVATPQDLVGVLDRALAEQWSEETFRDYETGLVGVGLWPPDRDLRAEFVSVFSGETAGLYVATEETIYVVQGATPPPLSLRLLSFFTRRDVLGEFVLSHEIVHLLQHRAYPGLFDPAQQRIDLDDLDNAIQAAIEGDALRYGYEAIGVSTGGLSSAGFGQAFEDDIAAGAGEDLRDAPALLRLTLAFPYVAGFPLSLAEGRALLERPPASTEQALHGSRRYEPFTVFDLGPVRAALPEGCDFVHENTLGELHLSVLFRDLARPAATPAGAEPPLPSPEAWYGWDGDRFLVARCGRDLELMWLTAWDSAEDAEEFQQAYAGIAPAVAERAGHRDAPRAIRQELDVVVATPALHGVAERAGSLAVRSRVSDVAELQAFYEVPATTP